MRCLTQILERFNLHKQTALKPAPFFLPVLLMLLLPLTGCEKLDELRQETSDTGAKTVRTTVPPEMQSDANSSFPSISADGRYIAFRSDATNLVPGITNGAAGIYVKDRQTGSTIRVSVNNDGAESDEDAINPVIAASGRVVAFESAAINLVAGTAANRCVEVSGTSANCQDVFVRDLDAGATLLTSAAPGGVKGNQDSGSPSMSADGRFVAFRSAAFDLVADDNNHRPDIFVRDMKLGDMKRASLSETGAEADDDSSRPSISGDGRLVAFSSLAENIVPSDANGKRDVFVKDMQSGKVTLVSATADGSPGDGSSGYSVVQLSADGHFVVFESEATNLVPDDMNGKRDIFIKNLETGGIARVSVSSGGEEGQEDSYKSAAVSGDGQWVAFQSNAPNLAPKDSNDKSDIFLRNMQTGNVTLISANSSGAAGNGDSDDCSISADGHWVTFDSSASNLTGEDTNGKKDIFLKETTSGSVTRVSTSTADV